MMFYFIPTWNQNHTDWELEFLEWYYTTKKMEFDDTVNQLMMFNRAEEKNKTIILEYAPMLRDFLQRQDLYDIDYYSIFDDLQDTKVENVRPIDPFEFDWPKNVQFIYMPFNILAEVNRKLYAQIISGNLGQLQRINFFEEDKITKTYIFDDRGFLSSVVRFNGDGQFEEQIFFNLAGEWRFKRLSSEEVIINPLFRDEFKREKYAAMRELIEEKYNEFAQENITKDDVIVIASEKRHNQRILNAKKSGRVILSIFSQRLNIEQDFPDETELAKVDVIVVDTQQNEKLVQEKLDAMNVSIPVLQIPPFDSRLRLGQSQRIKELKIFVLVDKTPLAELEIIVDEIGKAMLEDTKINLILGAYAANQEATEKLDKLKEKILDGLGLTEEEIEAIEKAENQIESETDKELIKKAKFFRRITFYRIESESEWIKELNFVRLIIDMGKDMDLYLQIAGISAGIPQINSTPSPYVENHKNGMIVPDALEIKEAIDYYLVGLKHWNQALVYAAGKIVQYSSDNLISLWNESLELATAKGEKLDE